MDQISKVLAALIDREPIFHRPHHGTTRADFERMTAPDFWETGASGRQYTRAEILDELDRRHAAVHDEVWRASDFRCRHLAGEVYLLTYNLLQDGIRKTRRMTIWEHTADGWLILYHQGTIVA